MAGYLCVKSHFHSIFEWYLKERGSKMHSLAIAVIVVFVDEVC